MLYSNHQVHTLTLTEQCTLVQDVTRKLASSKAAVKALAQAMALNEQDRHELKQKYQQAQTVITELKTLVEQFRREQDVLTKDKQALERQVKSHQDELQEQKVEATEHQEQIQDYQQALQRLRQQLRSTENCIPTKVYQHDVAEHRQQAEQQQRIIKALKTEIASLQQQLQGAQSANRLRFKHYVKGIIETTEKSAPMTWQRSTNAYRQPPPSPQPLPLVKPPPTTKTNAPVSRLQQRVDVTSSVTPSPPSVASPKTPKATLLINTSSSPPSSSSPTMTSTTKRALSRLSTLKAHGVGRAGLKERLKQIRKSPLATSSVIFFN
jgi:predicted  nucleic acid-binding Zn-ribbon protein